MDKKHLGALLFFMASLPFCTFAQTTSPELPPNTPVRPVSQAALQGLTLNLPADVLDDLSTRGLALRLTRGRPAFYANPFASSSAPMLAQLASIRANTSLEAVLVSPLPRRFAQAADPRLELVHTLLGFSTMEGLEYWSASRKTMRTFYTKSHAIASVRDTTPLPDPRPANLPRTASYTIFQEDQSFGKNTYSVVLTTSPGAPINMQISNLSGLSYGIIPALGPGQLVTYLSADIQNGYLILHIASGFPLPGIPGIGGRATTSFTNRLLALASWFYDQASL